MTELQHAIWLLATVTTVWIGLRLLLVMVQTFSSIYYFFTYKDSMSLVEKFLKTREGK